VACLLAVAGLATPSAAAAIDPPAPFLVNEYVTGTQVQPAVCALSDGSFAVAWTSAFEDGFGLGVYARTFDASLSIAFPAAGHSFPRLESVWLS